MQLRSQWTLRQPVETIGIGFFTGADVTIRFLPAPPNHGIAFQRTDIDGSALIPARLEFTVPRQRRTAIEHQGVTVEMVEHVMAALAGLQVDNCVVQVNAPEPPGFDGSSRPFVDCLMKADFVEQDEPRQSLIPNRGARVAAIGNDSEITARPLSRRSLVINYHLDYGSRSPIPPQNLTIDVTRDSFANELAFARTFVLESEVKALRAQGYGRRLTARDLLVFNSDGVIDNELRAPDECVRHKILDCVGDFALIGCDVMGFFSAYRSGHCLNQRMMQQIETANSHAGLKPAIDAA